MPFVYEDMTSSRERSKTYEWIVISVSKEWFLRQENCLPESAKDLNAVEYPFWTALAPFSATKYINTTGYPPGDRGSEL